MAWDADVDLTELVAAAKARERGKVRSLCDDLMKRIYASAEAYPTNPAKKLLQTLRTGRYFAEMERLADALIQTGAGSNTVRRLYAQALIDQSHFTAALLVLERLVADTEGTDQRENAEARGLVGRTYKQLYVNACEPGIARNQKWLDRAAEAYLQPYARDPESYAWHGINVAAVYERSVRDRVPLATPGLPAPATLAKDILDRVEDKEAVNAATVWDIGTATEACIALGKSVDALKWARKYVEFPAADAFEFSSTLRQLEEVWGLPRDPSGERRAAEESILSLLRATVLERESGEIERSPEQVSHELAKLQDTNLEKVFGADRFQSLEWYRNGLTRCAAVARIGRETSRGVGTGFFLKGTSLHESLGDTLYLLTNRHVLGPSPDIGIALSPDQAIVTFEGLPQAKDKSWRVRKIVFTSPISELDATLAELDGDVEGIEPYPIAPNLPSLDGKQRLYVVGHPLGGTLSFSLQDNLLLDWDQRKVHYRAPTEPGSSGSPVFDDQWRLVALHHAGSSSMPKLKGTPGTYEANEGISIHAIVAGIRKTFETA